MLRIKVKPHDAPEGARPYPELRPLVERRLAALERHAKTSKAGEHTYWTQRTILNRALADLPAAPVPADVQAWMAGLVSVWHCSVKTANKYRDSLSTAYEWDRLRGGEVNNPCVDVKRLRAPAPLKPALFSRKAGLTAKEAYKRAHAAVEKLCGERAAAAVGLTYLQGLRRSEVCGFEHHHFMLDNLEDAWVRVVQQRIPSARGNEPIPLKTEQRRMLPLTPEQAAELRAIVRKPAWVAPSERGSNQYQPPVRSPYVFPFNTDDLQAIHDAIRTVAEDVLPPGRGLHEFRHAFAEGALRHYNGNLTETGKRLGHSSEAVTAMYAKGRYAHFEIRRDPGLFSELEDRPTAVQVGEVKGGSDGEKRVDSGTQKVAPKRKRRRKKT